MTRVRELVVELPEAELREFVLAQRWYGSKSEEVASVRAVDAFPLRDEGEPLVAVAVVAGVLIARLGWLLTGWALPLAGLKPPPVPLPGSPHPLVLIAAGVLMFLVLALVAVLSGRRTLRLIR